MAFKQDNSSKATGFLEKNFAALIKNGLPLVIVEDPKNWWYFLDHGYHPEATYWSMRELNKQQAENLAHLIEFFDESASVLYELRRLALG